LGETVPLEGADLVGVDIAWMIIKLPVGELHSLSGKIMVQNRINMSAREQLHSQVIPLSKHSAHKAHYKKAYYNQTYSHKTLSRQNIYVPIRQFVTSILS
jgi:hypothetical protein